MININLIKKNLVILLSFFLFIANPISNGYDNNNIINNITPNNIYLLGKILNNKNENICKNSKEIINNLKNKVKPLYLFIQQKIEKRTYKNNINYIQNIIRIYTCVIDINKKEEAQYYKRNMKKNKILERLLLESFKNYKDKGKQILNYKEKTRQRNNSIMLLFQNNNIINIDIIKNFVNKLYKNKEFLNKNLTNISPFNIVIIKKEEIEKVGLGFSKYNYRNKKENINFIKIGSEFGERTLSDKGLDFHMGFDITVRNYLTDFNYNCNHLYKVKKLNKEKKEKFINYFLRFKKYYCDHKYIKKIGNKKNIYRLLEKINLKKIKEQGGDCYVGTHLSKYGNRTVGFGNFLICKMNKEDSLYFISGHNKYSKIGNFFKTVDKKSNEYKKISGIMATMYQGNYENYKNGGFKGNIIENYFNNFNLYNLKLYKIDIDKALKKGYKYYYSEFGNTGHSFGDHIHLGIFHKIGAYIFPIYNNSDWYSVLKKIIGNNFGERNFYLSLKTVE